MASGSVQRVDLAAEAAADRAADEMQPVRRHVEDLGGGAEREEQRLRRGVARRSGRWSRARRWSRWSRSARARSATSGSALRRRGRPRANARLDIAEAQLLVIVLVVILEGVGRVGLVDDRRAGLDRLLDVEHVRAAGRSRRGPCASASQRLRLALGDDGDDRLALVAHLVDRRAAARRPCRSRCRLSSVLRLTRHVGGRGSRA